VETLAGDGAHLHLETIGCTVPLTEVYNRIVFPATEAP
jgi:hypothetical protein